MAVNNLFSQTVKGALSITGNTLGLCKARNTLGPGNVGSVGGQVTTNTSLETPSEWTSVVDLNNGENITYDWNENSSMAVLNLPAGAQVLYAALVWSAKYKTASNGGVTSNIKDPVDVTTPSGKKISVSTMEENSIYEIDIGGLFYVNVGNITDTVVAEGAGKYIVGKVPTLVEASDNNANAVNWCIVAAYKDNNQTLKNLNIWTIGAAVGVGKTTDVQVSGFATPDTGSVEARVLIFATEGESSSGDRALFGDDVSSLKPLSGPNNPAGNFFLSQINNNNGELDTSGTFGNRNSPSTSTGYRQGTDITSVDGTGFLSNSVNSAAFRFTSTGEGYIANMLALAIAVNAAVLSITKSADKSGAKLEDTVTYTIDVKNIGTTQAIEVVLSDTIPDGMTYVDGSLMVDEAANSGNIQTGISIDDIAVGNTVTIKFDVKVGSSIPSINPTVNVACAQYKYIPAAGLDPLPDASCSNEVQVIIGDVNLDEVQKSVDKDYADLNEEITYTITIPNKGESPVQNAILTDEITSSGVSFVPGSVTIDGISSSDNPQTGINIGDIAGNETIVVMFKAIANEIPNPNPIVNNVSLTYQYQIDPNQPPNSITILSNDTITQINHANINPDDGSLLKKANTNVATLGDEITYSINIKNDAGNVDIINVSVVDIIPDGTEFVDGSVSINGDIKPDMNPSNIPVGTVPTGQETVVVFKVLIKQVPANGELKNSASVSYQYIINPNNPPIDNTSDTNEVIISTVVADLSSIQKSVDKDYADINEAIEYTITMQNTGNVDAMNVIITDTLASDGVEFVDSSITINGSSASGNPQTGINVGNIMVGQTATVEFSVIATKIPDPNPILNSAVVKYEYNIEGASTSAQNLSNEVQTQINHGGFSGETNGIVKTSDREVVMVGDNIVYTIDVTNTGNVDVNDVIVTDVLPASTSFVSGSVIVDGNASSQSPITGIQIGTIVPNQTVSISFSVLVDSLPDDKTISNSAGINYSYYVNPNNLPISGSDESEPVVIRAEFVEIDIEKSSNKSAVVSGDKITYTLIVSNKSSIVTGPVVVKDTIPDGAQYIESSLTVNGEARPNDSIINGVTLPSMELSQVVVVTFDVLVI